MQAELLQAMQLGRGNDTILAHINPEEAELLKMLGGSGAVNPHTGLLEFDSDSGGGAGMSGSDGPGTAGSGPGGQGPGGPGGDNDGDNGIGSMGGWSTGGLGLDEAGNVTGPPGFDSPGYSMGQGWGMAEGYGSDPTGSVTGPNGFDAPGFSTSTSNPNNSAPGFGEVSSGFNGALGSLLSGLNTVASFAVPGYAPIGMGISTLNGLSALTNGIGLTNTGQLGPSLGEAATSLGQAMGISGQGGWGAAGGPGGPGGPTGPSANPSGTAQADNTGMVGTPGVGDMAQASGPAGLGMGASAATDGAAGIADPLAGAASTTTTTTPALAQQPQGTAQQQQIAAQVAQQKRDALARILADRQLQA